MTDTQNTHTESKEEVFSIRCYELDGIVYVPHYKHPNSYVGPGYGKQHNNEYSAYMLERRGAKPRYEVLWKRHKSYYEE